MGHGSNNPGGRIIVCFRNGPLNCQPLSPTDPRYEHIVTLLVHPLDDCYDLFARFSFTQDHFWKAPPQGTVMINSGMTNIFEGKASQGDQRITDFDLPRLDVLE